jgi:5'-nucleotidase
MKNKPHILITNDDGLFAPGIRHLAKALAPHAHLTIVAPSFEQSGMGLAISIRSELVLETHELPFGSAWSVTGTPADCVKMALSVILPSLPDLIVSGINRGSNHGRTALYSGTVGAVIEGALRGVNGIAFSSYDYEETEYELFEPYIPQIVSYVLENPLPSGTLLNVNFPSILEHPEIKTEQRPLEIRLTRQGKQYWAELPQEQSHRSYILGAKLLSFQEHEESDAFLLNQGYITATPVHVGELTDQNYFASQKSTFDALFSPFLETRN